MLTSVPSDGMASPHVLHCIACPESGPKQLSRSCHASGPGHDAASLWPLLWSRNVPELRVKRRDADLLLCGEHIELLLAGFADMSYLSMVATETEICFNASHYRVLLDVAA